MANQIVAAAQLTLNGTVQLQGNGSLNVAQVGTNGIAETLGLTTTTAQLSIGSVVNVGFLFVKNLDATNNVRIGLATPVTSGNCFADIPPGGVAMVPIKQTVIYAIAVAATPQIFYQVIEL